jgi:hypothetical protein
MGVAFVNLLLTCAEQCSRMKRDPAQYLPVVAEEPYSTCAFPELDSWNSFEGIKDSKVVQWRNETTTRRSTHAVSDTERSVEMFRSHNPGFVKEYIARTPLLMTVADADTLNPPDLILEAYNEAREPKKIQFVKGGHWAIYGGSEFEKNVKTQAAFLKKYIFPKSIIWLQEMSFIVGEAIEMACSFERFGGAERVINLAAVVVICRLQFRLFVHHRVAAAESMKATCRVQGPSSLVSRTLCCQFQHRSLSTLCSPLNSSQRRVSPVWAPYRLDRRHAGTKLHKLIEELPQGLQLPLEPFIEKEASKYSPVIDEVLQNQKCFPKCILLTRVGQFYEVSSSP